MEGEQEAFGGQSMDKYKRTEPIGSGAYGIVYKGYNTQTMETIAVKRIKIEVILIFFVLLEVSLKLRAYPAQLFVKLAGFGFSCSFFVDGISTSYLLNTRQIIYKPIILIYYFMLYIHTK